MAKEISLENLTERLDRGAPVTLVEALAQRYFDDAHLPGAIRLGPDEAERAASILPDRDAFIVTYCTGPSCANSGQLADALERQGYGQVSVFKGGKEAWAKAGRVFGSKAAA